MLKERLNYLNCLSVLCIESDIIKPLSHGRGNKEYAARQMQQEGVGKTGARGGRQRGEMR